LNRNFVWIFLLFHVCYMPRSSHPPLFDHPDNIWGTLQIMKLIIEFCSASCSQTSLVWCSRNVRDHVPHPYKTMGKIRVLCIIIFVVKVIILPEIIFSVQQSDLGTHFTSVYSEIPI
jgi:hypothetical protein